MTEEQPILTEAIFKAKRFQEDIERYVKHYQPDVFIVQLATLVDRVFNNREELMSRFPLHFLLHAMEANCAYHRKYPPESVPDQVFYKLINIYQKYKDPVAQILFLEQDGFNLNTSLFFVFMARQQFYLQLMENQTAMSRTIFLFNEENYPKTINEMNNHFEFGFSEWLFFTLSIFGFVWDKNPPLIHQNFFSSEFDKAFPPYKINRMFSLLATNSDEVKNNYLEMRNKYLIYDPYIRSIFEEKPLFKLNNSNYIVTHKPLVLKRFTEGLFDLCYQYFGVEFGKEFGYAFENYIRKLLVYINNNKIVIEKEIKNYIRKETREYLEKEICDYIVVGDDYVLLGESKGVEYNAVISSENAVKNHNSTTKVSKAIDQIFSTAILLNSGKFYSVVGDLSNKKFMAVVVTFKQIYMVNADEYWNEVILPKIKNKNTVEWEKIFEFRPQIFDISEFEDLILVILGEQSNLYSIFQNKLKQSYHEVGDWGTYLSKIKKESYRIPFLSEAYNNIPSKLLSELKDKYNC